MKKLFILTTLIFTVLFSTPSYSEWTEVGEGSGSSNSGDTFYVDFERIRKHGGYVYYWTLSDYLKPLASGYLSSKMYKQGDCKLFRYKYLSWSYHKEPMGVGTGETPPVPKEHKDWKYPPPNSVNEVILKLVCSR